MKPSVSMSLTRSAPTTLSTASAGAYSPAAPSAEAGTGATSGLCVSHAAATFNQIPCRAKPEGLSISIVDVTANWRHSRPSCETHRRSLTFRLS
jgi:hypothetical protein